MSSFVSTLIVFFKFKERGKILPLKMEGETLQNI